MIKVNFGEPKNNVKIIWVIKRQCKESPKICFTYFKFLLSRTGKFTERESRIEVTRCQREEGK